MPKVKCTGCPRWLCSNETRTYIRTIEHQQRWQPAFPVVSVTLESFFCEKCRSRLNTYEKEARESNTSGPSGLPALSQSSSSSGTSGEGMDVDPTYEPDQAERGLIEIHFPRTAITERRCFVCGSETHRNIVTPQARQQAFLVRRLFIPKLNRCCPEHYSGHKLYNGVLRNIRVASPTSLLDEKELREYMELLTVGNGASLKDRIGTGDLTEEQIKSFTGLTHEQLASIEATLKSMRNVEGRSKLQALVIFLFKMRTGSSNDQIAALFELTGPQRVSDIVQSVIASFEVDVLPGRFGLFARTRSDLIQNETTPVFRELYGADKLALIFDGTYLRHGKSANNFYQRKSYSGQKKTHLCKPFTICTTTGYVVDMLWPSLATLNDARIMEWALTVGVENLLERRDVCIVDRGFRDVKRTLENDRGYGVLMPVCKGQRSQLTAAEANESRFVTKVRWAVEAVHGIIKQKYRIFDHRVDNNLLPKIGTMLRIACYLNNVFGKRLTSDETMFEEVVGRMIHMRHVPNTLGEEVEANGWNRGRWATGEWSDVISSSIPEFPELTERDLKIFFTGTYQLTQAISYLAELLKDNETITLKYLRINSNILKMRVQSRHSNAKQYRCFIDYIPDAISHQAIRRHYCDCPNGARTVGCCSHIATIIYYLSHARHEDKILRPAEHLSSLFNDGAVVPVIEEDSDDDDGGPES